MPDSYHTRRKIVRTAFETAIYCLTGETFSNGRGNIEVVTRMLAAGVKIIQYREKEKSTREQLAQCRQLRALTAAAGALFIVNDNVAVAMAVGADGVHVGQDDLPVEDTRQLVGPDMIIGLSTHTPAQAQAAVRLGADYIGVGPIFKTDTKKDVGDPVGFEYLDYVVKHIDLPFTAIGGIKQHNVAAVAARGAACVAMVTEIVGSADMEAKIKTIRQLIDSHQPAST